MYAGPEKNLSVKDQTLILQSRKLRGEESASTLRVIEPDQDPDLSRAPSEFMLPLIQGFEIQSYWDNRRPEIGWVSLDA